VCCVERALKSHLQTRPLRHSRASNTAHRNSRPKRTGARPKQRDGGATDLQQLLIELALVLLPRGVTPTSFAKLARKAFIRAAASQARLGNGKLNHSKIAALTGLPRKEIKRILKHPTVGFGSDFTNCRPPDRVVRGWLTDRRFLTRQNRPKSLAVSEGSFSFGRLVKEYGGDVSPRAVLEELVRAKTVRRAGDRLKLQATRRQNRVDGLGPLNRVIPTLVDGLRIASHRSTSPIGSALYRLRLQAATEVELALIRQRCTSAIQSLLHGLKESLEHEFTRPVRQRSSRHALTVTVLLGDADIKKS
jgi:hypothetical protein